MTHPAYLLARLNAKNARFDIGAGGIADLTPQDIAAALAYVTPGLGREILCHIWWPDGARLKASYLDEMLLRIQLDEWNRREAEMFRALGAVASHSGKSDLERATKMYARAHANSWPNWIVKLEPLQVTPTYTDIRKAVLEEISHPRNCPDCKGRGHHFKMELVTACIRCDGTGKIPFGTTWRAARLGMKEASYKNTWQNAYEWLFDFATESLQRASRELSTSIE